MFRRTTFCSSTGVTLSFCVEGTGLAELGRKECVVLRLLFKQAGMRLILVNSAATRPARAYYKLEELDKRRLWFATIDQSTLELIARRLNIFQPGRDP